MLFFHANIWLFTSDRNGKSRKSVKLLLLAYFYLKILEKLGLACGPPSNHWSADPSMRAAAVSNSKSETITPAALKSL